MTLPPYIAKDTMQIETYECEELKTSEATTMAVDAESIELIEKLGLKGQAELTNKETLTRDPYREMTKLEYFVYKTLYPEATPVEAYRLSPMPIRILQVIAYARELGIYEAVVVWHPKQIKDDPLLVGVPRGQEWGSRRHLIARWGESLKPFAELTVEAKVRYRAVVVDALTRIKRQAELSLDTVNTRIEAAFANESFELPQAYHLDACD